MSTCCVLGTLLGFYRPVSLESNVHAPKIVHPKYWAALMSTCCVPGSVLCLSTDFISPHESLKR